MKYLLIFAVAFSFNFSSAQAQEPEFPQPEAEHLWLKQFAGEWTSSSKSTPIGEQPAMESSGKMSSKMLGGFWIINKMDAEVGGMKFKAIQTIGYDTKKKKYVGTWVDSMMNYMWHYEGTVDKTGKKIQLVAEGPNMIGGTGKALYRDSYEFKSADRIIATTEVQDDTGQWIIFLTGELVRGKK